MSSPSPHKRPSRFGRSFRLVSILILVAFALLQLIRPTIDNPPVTADLSAPPEVKAILKKACYDCHSNETQLKWFDKVSPAIWLVAGHIREGRKALNFSHWDSLAPGEQKAHLFEAFNQLQLGAMPLQDYTRFHHGAILTYEEISTLKSYIGSLAPLKHSDTAAIHAAERQYAQWIAGGFPIPSGSPSSAASVPPGPAASLLPAPAPNGVEYIRDYASWQAISTSDRFDNGTLRRIAGNPIAIRAILEHDFNPWPDGTIFAKIAWQALVDSAGKITPGEFKQVEFMIKDSKKYAATDGWGWGRWRGMSLQPYGKNALFVTECMNCHQPLKDEDFVYTMPIPDAANPDGYAISTTPRPRTTPAAGVYNHIAALPKWAGSLAFNPLAWRSISILIDKKQHTMSTLYGNDTAAAWAAHPTGDGYPPGAVLALVTWEQQEDIHWFGAEIPGAVQSVEWIGFGAAGPQYHILKGKKGQGDTGSPGGKDDVHGQEDVRDKDDVRVKDAAWVRDRIAWIAQQRLSVIP